MAEEGIVVAIRPRPLNGREKIQGQRTVWRCLAEHDSITQTTPDGNPLPDRNPGFTFFTYDKVFSENATTPQVYEAIGHPIVSSVVEGFNGTIFAYGQTSSGKTYTMVGGSGDGEEGMLQLAARSIFRLISETSDRDFLLRVSFVEIYNENVRDLLDPETPSLTVREDPRKGVYIEASEMIITDFESIVTALRTGSKHRRVEATAMNERSSRSHTIFRMVLESKARAPSEASPPTTDAVSAEATAVAIAADAPSDVDGAVLVATLNLVDLAGSESVRHTGATGARAKEGGKINQSLLSLSRVIHALGQEGNVHVNFRDSKLTRILQPSLSGNAKMAVVCCITPAERYIEETRSTLQFASRAKMVRTRAVINEVLDDRAQLKRLKKELQELKEKQKQLEAVGSSVGMVSLDDLSRLEAEKRLMSGRVEELEAVREEQATKITRLTDLILHGGGVMVAGEVGPAGPQASKGAARGLRRPKRLRETWCPGESGVPLPPGAAVKALQELVDDDEADDRLVSKLNFDRTSKRRTGSSNFSRSSAIGRLSELAFELGGGGIIEEEPSAVGKRHSKADGEACGSKVIEIAMVHEALAAWPTFRQQHAEGDVPAGDILAAIKALVDIAAVRAQQKQQDEEDATTSISADGRLTEDMEKLERAGAEKGRRVCELEEQVALLQSKLTVRETELFQSLAAGTDDAQRCHDLTDEVSRLTACLADQSATMVATKESLAAAEEQAMLERGAAAASTAEAESLRVHVQELEAAMDAYKQQAHAHTSCHETLSQLGAELLGSRQTIESLTSRLAEKDRVIQSLQAVEAEVSDLKTQLTVASDVAAEQGELVRTLQTAQTEWEIARAALQDKLVATEEAMTAAQSEAQRLDTDLINMTSAVESERQADAVRLEEDAVRSAAIVEQLTTELQQAGTRLSEALAERESAVALLEEAQRQLVDARAELAVVCQGATESAEAMTALQCAKEQWDREVDVLKKRAEAAEVALADAQAEGHRLSEEIARLTSETENERMATAEAEAAEKAAAAVVEQLTAQLQDTQGANKSLTEALDEKMKLVATLQDAEKQLMVLSEAMVAKDEAVVAMQREKEQYEAERGAESDRAEALEAALTVAQAEAERLTNEVRSLTSDLEHERAAALETAEWHAAEVNRLTAQLHEAQQTRAQLAESLQEKEQEVASLEKAQAELADLPGRVSELSEAVTAKEAAITTMDGAREQVEADAAALNERVGVAEAALARAEAEAQRLNDEVSTLTAALESKRAAAVEAAELDMRLSEACQSVNVLTKSVEEKEEVIAALEAAQNNARDELAAASESLSAKEQCLDAVEQAKTLLEAQVSALKADAQAAVAAANEGVQRLKEEHTGLASELESERTAAANAGVIAADMHARLKAELEEAQRTIEVLTQRVQDEEAVSTSLQATHEELGSLRAEITALSESAVAKEEVMKAVQHAYEQLKAQNLCTSEAALSTAIADVERLSHEVTRLTSALEAERAAAAESEARRGSELAVEEMRCRAGTLESQLMEARRALEFAQAETEAVEKDTAAKASEAAMLRDDLQQAHARMGDLEQQSRDLLSALEQMAGHVGHRVAEAVEHTSIANEAQAIVIKVAQAQRELEVCKAELEDARTEASAKEEEAAGLKEQLFGAIASRRPPVAAPSGDGKHELLLRELRSRIIGDMASPEVKSEQDAPTEKEKRKSCGPSVPPSPALLTKKWRPSMDDQAEGGEEHGNVSQAGAEQAQMHLWSAKEDAEAISDDVSANAVHHEQPMMPQESQSSREEVEALRLQVTELTTEVARLNEDTGELKQALAALEMAKASAEAEARRLQEHVDTKEEEFARLSHDLEEVLQHQEAGQKDTCDAAVCTDRVIDQTERLNSQMETLTLELQTATMAVEAVRAEMESAAASAAEYARVLEADVQTRRDQVSGLTVKVAELQQQVEAERERAENATTALAVQKVEVQVQVDMPDEAAAAQLKDALSRLDSLSNELSEVTDELMQKDSDLWREKRRAEELASELARSRANVVLPPYAESAINEEAVAAASKAHATLLTQQNAKSEAEKTLSQAMQQMHDAREEQRHSEERVLALTMEKEEAQAAARREEERLQNELALRESTISELHDQLERAAHDLKLARDELSVMHAAVASSDDASLRKRVSQLQTQLDLAQSLVSKHEVRVKALEAEKQTLVREAQSEQERMQREMEVSRKGSVQVGDIRRELQSIKEAHAALSKKVEVLKAERDDAQQRATQAVEALSSLEEEVYELRGKVNGGENVESLKQELEAARAAHAEAQAEASQLQSRVRRLQHEVEAMNDECTRAREDSERLQQQQTDSAELRSAYEKAVRQLSLKTEEVDALKSILQQLQTTLHATEEQVRDLGVQVAAGQATLERERHEVSERVRQVEAETAAQLSGKTEEAMALRAAVQQVQEALNESEQRVRELLDQASQAQGCREKDAAETAELVKRLHVAEQDLTSARATAQQLEAARNALIGELNALVEAPAEAESKAALQEQENKRLRQALEEAQSVHDHDGQVQDLQALLAQKEQEYATVHGESYRLKRELSELRDAAEAAEEAIKSQQAEVQRLRDEVSAQRSTIQQLEGLVQSLNADMQAKDERIKKLDAVKMTTDWVDRFKRMKNERAGFAAENERLKQELTAQKACRGPPQHVAATTDHSLEVEELTRARELLNERLQISSATCRKLELERAAVIEALQELPTDVQDVRFSQVPDDLGVAVGVLVQRLVGHVAEGRSEASKNKTDRSMLIREVNTLTDEKEELKRKIHELTALWETTQQREIELESKLFQALEQCRVLEGEVVSVQARLRDLELEQQAKAEEQQRNIRFLEQENLELMKEGKTLTNRIIKLQAEVETLRKVLQSSGVPRPPVGDYDVGGPMAMQMSGHSAKPLHEQLVKASVVKPLATAPAIGKKEQPAAMSSVLRENKENVPIGKNLLSLKNMDDTAPPCRSMTDDDMTAHNQCPQS